MRSTWSAFPVTTERTRGNAANGRSENSTPSPDPSWTGYPLKEPFTDLRRAHTLDADPAGRDVGFDALDVAFRLLLRRLAGGLVGPVAVLLVADPPLRLVLRAAVVDGAHERSRFTLGDHSKISRASPFKISRARTALGGNIGMPLPMSRTRFRGRRPGTTRRRTVLRPKTR
jgi:hypothetical protein